MEATIVFVDITVQTTASQMSSSKYLTFIVGSLLWMYSKDRHNIYLCGLRVESGNCVYILVHLCDVILARIHI